MQTKGIILAGGAGTRLSPITNITSKQLLLIYDKPLIYFPLSTLMLGGIRDILIISTSEHQSSFIKLLGDGSNLGLNIAYAIQDKPNGLAEAFIIGEEFINNQPSSLILGDNIFYGQGLGSAITSSIHSNGGATVFGSYVEDPSRYGVAVFDEHGRIQSIVEKPSNPLSNIAVTGLYVYDHTVVSKAKTLKPSSRGELEITDLNNIYLEECRLKLVRFGRGMAWFDTGTFDSLLDASYFIKTLQKRQNLRIGCLEEIAYRQNFINLDQLIDLVRKEKNPDNKSYLLNLLQEEGQL